MGGGNGAKAAQKRARNAKATAAKPSSQLKTNVAAMNIICTTCKQTFLQTIRLPQLTQHAEEKHGKKPEECFAHLAA
ncbi:At2g23090 like protein [Cladorrhinum sp. PSN332]|nr:At2g23090 like protein [Cladorrhinum sp. PSN332]